MSDLERFIKQCRKVWKKMGIPAKMRDVFIQQLAKEGVTYANISDETIERVTNEALKVKEALDAEKK